MNRLKRYRSQEGAAYTEAVVVLPVIILVFACLYLVHSAWVAKTVALRVSRGNAWSQAQVETCDENGGEIQEGGASAPNQATEDGATPPTSDTGEDVSNPQSYITSFLDTDIPGLEVIVGLMFGKSTTGSDSQSYSAPDFYAGTTTASAQYILLCNARRTTIAQLIRDIFCSFGIVPSWILKCGG